MSRRHWLIMILLAGLSAGMASGGGETRVRTKLYFCQRAEKPPVLDGVLDDPCWKEAPVIEDFGFLRWGDHAQPMPKTYVRAVYDNDNLYFGFDCKEPLVNKLRDSLKSSAAVYGNDCLEIYIDTQNDDTGYTALWANGVGATLSERLIKLQWAVVADSSFRLWARWGYVPRMNPDGWVVEMKVAMKDLGVSPRDGTVMGFNPCRFRFVAGVGQFVGWSTINSSQKNAGEYGHMILGKAPANMADVLKTLYPDFASKIIEIPAGTAVQLYENGKATTLTYADMLNKRLTEVKGQLAEMVKAMGAQSTNSVFMKAPAQNLATTKKKLEAAETAFKACGTAVEEGTSLQLLGTFNEVEKALSDLGWDIRNAAMLDVYATKAVSTK